ncbi:MAG: SIMPL domain-containing protein [Burkholderiaceae bacterium]
MLFKTMLCVAALGAPLLADAGPLVNLEAQANRQVPNDEMVVSLAATRTGPAVGPLNEAVLGALNDALRRAKAAPAVDARLGGVVTGQDWRDGKPDGWRVRGEIVLTSTDMKALGALAGELGRTLEIDGVSFRLSPGVRTATETALLQEAAAGFRAKADAATKAFGFRTYEIQELSLNQSMPPPMPRPMATMSMAKAAPVPAEPGTAEVVVTVNGRIRVD